MSFFYSLDFQFPKRAENLCYQIKQGLRNSRHSPARLSACYPPALLFAVNMLLYTHASRSLRRDFTKDTDFSVSFFYSLDFQFPKRAENLCYQIKQGLRNSRHSPARLSACYPPALLFAVNMLLYTHASRSLRRDFTKDTDFSVSFFYSLDFQFPTAQAQKPSTWQRNCAVAQCRKPQ